MQIGERSIVDQFAGLEPVATQLWAAGISCAVIWEPGDVPCVTVSVGEADVVYAHGGYDVWRHGKPAQFNISLESAVQVLTDAAGRVLK